MLVRPMTFNGKIVLIVCSNAIVGQHRNRGALEQVKCSCNAKTSYGDFLKSLQKSGGLLRIPGRKLDVLCIYWITCHYMVPCLNLV